MATPKAAPSWLALAVGSGAFAATNGVFAKLTTATHTHTLAERASQALGAPQAPLEVVLRASFFGLNLASNAVMWVLFTRALTAGTSTTRVAVLNTSANFVVTALLGMLVFSEALPLLWWLGAAMLVAGSVVIGARENKEQEGQIALGGQEGVLGEAVPLDGDEGAGAEGEGDVVEGDAVEGDSVEGNAVEGEYRD